MPAGPSTAAFDAGYCRAVYLPDKTILASSVKEDVLKHFPVDKLSNPIETLTGFEEGIADIALSKKADRVVVGAEDHEVSIFNTVDRTKVGSDGFEINVVHMDTKKQSVLGGHASAVKAVAYDPLDTYLASIDSSGLLLLTRVDNQTSVYSKNHFPKTEGKDAPTLRLSWHPQGNLLAVPGRSEVQLVGRDTWNSVGELKGFHSKPVSVVEFSPNGKYLASAGTDLKLVVWEVSSQSLVSSESINLSSPCTSISWSPSDNALVYACANGQLSLWLKPVPDALPDPFTVSVAAPAADKASDGEAQQQPLTGKRKAEDEPSEDLPMGIKEEEEQDGAEEVREGETAENGVEEEEDDTYQPEQSSEEEDPNNSDDETTRKERRRLRKKAKLAEKTQLAAAVAAAASQATANLQPPFISGAAPESTGSKSKYYLLWNALGTVTSQNQDTYSVITTEYSEKSKKSSKGFKDHNGYKMCALGEHGAIFVSYHSRETPSHIYFQQMDGWGAQGDWHFNLPRHEDPLGCAIGDTWAVVATSQQFIRVFSYGGVQRGLLSLEGPLLTMASQTSLLAIVFHKGPPVGGMPNLGLRVMDMHRREVKYEGSCPVSPDSTLTWLSFVENGMLMSADSTGIVRGLSRYWGNTWNVMLDLTQAKQVLLDREAEQKLVF